MTDLEKLNKIMNLVSKIPACKEIDEEDINGACGGNIDDAFNMGYSNGESSLADAIKEILKN